MGVRTILKLVVMLQPKREILSVSNVCGTQLTIFDKDESLRLKSRKKFSISHI